MNAADLDALDRGVIQAGQLAAQTLSRIAALEARVDGLSAALEAAHAVAGDREPGSEYDVAAAVQARRREMRLAETEASQ